MTTKMTEATTFIETVTTTPTFVNPLAMTFHPDTVSAHLEMVRAQLERLAHERGLASAFQKDGHLAPDLQMTDLGNPPLTLIVERNDREAL